MIREIINLAQYQYAFPAWPPFIVGFSILSLSTAVIVRERFSQISTAFFFLCGSAFVWLFSVGLMYSSVHPAMALRWARAEHVGVAFIPSALFYFTLILVKRHLRFGGLIRVAFAVSAVFAYMAVVSRQWITGLQNFEWGCYPQYGYGGALFLIFFFVLLAASLFLIWRSYHRFQASVQQNQLKTFFGSFLIAFCGSIDFLACYHIRVYPIGYLPVYAGILLMAQAIWRYRFADITAAFAANEIIATMPSGLVVLDHRGIICLANKTACELIGKTELELIGMPVVEIIQTKEILTTLHLRMRRDTLHDFEITIQHPVEGQRLLSLSASAIRDTLGEPMAYVCVAQDITDRRRSQKALEISEIRFRRLLDSNIIGFMRVDFDGHILEANDAFLNMVGYTQEDLITGRVSGVAMTPNEYDAVDEWMRGKLRSQGVCMAIDKEYIRKDGSRVPVLVGAVKLTDTEDECLCFIVDSTDRRAAQEAIRKAYDELELRVQERTAELQHEVTRRREAEHALRSMAVTDPLTGLYNRRGFVALAEQHLKLAQREKRRLRLYFADLDGLKPINDLHGHQEGDNAILQGGTVLRGVFRASDVVARIGGDEFAVITLEDDDAENTRHLNDLEEKIKQYNDHSGLPYKVGMSLGSACLEPGESMPLAQLMDQADQALYAQKKGKQTLRTTLNP
jgi:diguanylate cyclase (GGDEF)-like protein/PAS domain S-box-containing protein